MDWDQSDAYCRAVGKRLPTEGEWEWAARGGDRATTYPWGDDAPGNRLCWDGKGSDLKKYEHVSTCAVGSYPRGDSPQGLKDLAGNVSEWTSSAQGASRVSRGGGWFSDHRDLSVSAVHRSWTGPEYRSGDLGFRCAGTP